MKSAILQTEKMEKRAGNPTKGKRPPRRRKQRGTTSTNIGIALLILSIFILLIVGAGSINQNGIVHANRNWPLHTILFTPARPLIALLGQAVFFLPFFVAMSGILYLWRSHNSTRQRRITQLAFSLPLMSIFLSAMAKIFGLPESWGGLIGYYYFNYAANFAGTLLGLILGVLIAVILFLSVWKKLDLLQKAHTRLKTALRHSRKFVKSILSQRSSIFSTKPHPRPGNPSGPPMLSPIKNESPPPIFANPVDKAPWDAFDEPSPPGLDPVPKPLPDPVFQERLSVTILPDPPEFGHSRHRLLDSLPALQEKVIEVINRTSQIKLIKEGYDPVVGLNSILFEFTKSAGQSLPIGAVERSLKDIGIATKRAPARLTIQDRICIELPLKPEERSFAPIKALLMDMLPEESNASTISPSYLIGRCQDGTPFQLRIEDAKHLLVGGGTGGGKSVLLHAIIFGIIFRHSPRQIRLALVDHKMIEFSAYKNLPHLWYPVVTGHPEFSELIDFLWDELERRKKQLSENFHARFPIILTIIDEFAEFDSRKLVRLIAEARALNMFFILATQHPTKESVSTSIKANMITRLAFRTKELSGSQLLVGTSDAMGLKGKGDCLVLSEHIPLTRVQAAWVTTPRDSEDSDILALKRFLADLNSDPSEMS